MNLTDKESTKFAEFFVSPLRQTVTRLRCGLVWAALAVLAPSAMAQQQFDDLGGGHLPPGPGPTWILGSVTSMASGDVDGDGDVDFVFAEYGDRQMGATKQAVLYLNDGSGNFAVAPANLPAIGYHTAAVELGDMDGDGDLDMVLANHGPLGGQNRLYLNDGRGVFADATYGHMPFVPELSRAVALGDVDGDGDNDMIFTSWDQGHLYLNDGSGRFSVAAGRLAKTRDADAIALSDMDGDGDLDLATSAGELGLNDGTGTFIDVSGTNMPPRIFSRGMASGDVDGDGDIDLVFTSPGYSGSPAQDRLYLNDGTGAFSDVTAARMPVHEEHTNAVALGDVDGDGDLDMVFGGGYQSPYIYPTYRGEDRLYLNDGSGLFEDVSSRLEPDGWADDVALGDVDGDGDLDLIFGGPQRLYFNMMSQLDAPLQATLNGEYRIDAYSYSDTPRSDDLVIPFISPARASIPMYPFGTVGIDPSVMIPLPRFTISKATGMGSVSFVVPDLPDLIGVPVHAQALIVRSPGQATLTNVTSDRIGRD